MVRACFILILAPMLLGAAPSPGALAAAKHARFAAEMAKVGVRIADGFLEPILDVVNDSSCTIDEQALADLDPSEQHKADLYIQLICLPSSEFIDQFFTPCISEATAPSWCREDLIDTLMEQRDAYFHGLTQALILEDESLARYNIMATMVGALDQHCSPDQPEAIFLRWLQEALHHFLLQAQPTDVILISTQFQDTPVGFHTEWRKQVREYMENASSLTDLQRATLIQILESRHVD